MLKHLCLYLTSVGNNTLRLHVREDGLWHSPINDGGLVIELFTDSDWAAHKGYRRSVSSGAVFFQYCLLLPTSRAQGILALSSAEAEVHAAVSTTCDALLLRVCIGFCLGKTTRLKSILDNTAAKQLLQRSGVGTIRHLSCRVLWIQGLVKRRELETASSASNTHERDFHEFSRFKHKKVFSRSYALPQARCWCFQRNSQVNLLERKLWNKKVQRGLQRCCAHGVRSWQQWSWPQSHFVTKKTLKCSF